MKKIVLFLLVFCAISVHSISSKKNDKKEIDVTNSWIGDHVRELALNAGIDMKVVNSLQVFQRRFSNEYLLGRLSSESAQEIRALSLKEQDAFFDTFCKNKEKVFGGRFSTNSNKGIIYLPLDIAFPRDDASILHELGHNVRKSGLGRDCAHFVGEEFIPAAFYAYLFYSCFAKKEKALTKKNFVVLIVTATLSRFIPWMYTLYDEFMADLFSCKHSNLEQLEYSKQGYIDSRAIKFGARKHYEFYYPETDSTFRYHTGRDSTPVDSDGEVIYSLSEDLAGTMNSDDPHPPYFVRIWLVVKFIKQKLKQKEASKKVLA